MVFFIGSIKRANSILINPVRTVLNVKKLFENSKNRTFSFLKIGEHRNASLRLAVPLKREFGFARVNSTVGRLHSKAKRFNYEQLEL